PIRLLDQREVHPQRRAGVADVQAEPHDGLLYTIEGGLGGPLRASPRVAPAKPALESGTVDRLLHSPTRAPTFVAEALVTRGLQPSERRDVEPLYLPGPAPAMTIEPDASAPHDDALLLQQEPLGHHARHVGAKADPTLRVHDAMPWDIRRAMPHGPAYRS